MQRYSGDGTAAGSIWSLVKTCVIVCVWIISLYMTDIPLHIPLLRVWLLCLACRCTLVFSVAIPVNMLSLSFTNQLLCLSVCLFNVRNLLCWRKGKEKVGICASAAYKGSCDLFSYLYSDYCDQTQNVCTIDFTSQHRVWIFLTLHWGYGDSLISTSVLMLLRLLSHMNACPWHWFPS